MGAYAGPNISTDGLALCLDAANSESYPGSGTTWFDLSSSANNGTLVNGVGYSDNNLGYLTFNGSNHFVNCGQGLSQDGSWTIGAFARPTSITGAAQAILFRSGDASTSFVQNYGIYIKETTNAFWCQSSANSYRGAAGTTVAVANTWYYVVGVYNSSTQIINVYVNGIMEGTSLALTSAPPTTGTQYLTMGAASGLSAGSPFTGNIATAHIYNRLLSNNEILQNFNALRKRFGI